MPVARPDSSETFFQQNVAAVEPPPLWSGRRLSLHYYQVQVKRQTLSLAERCSMSTCNCVPSSALLTREQAAEYLGVAPQTLAVWATTRRYDLRYIKVGRLARYRRADLEAFSQSRTVGAHGRVAPNKKPRSGSRPLTGVRGFIWNGLCRKRDKKSIVRRPPHPDLRRASTGTGGAGTIPGSQPARHSSTPPDRPAAKRAERCDDSGCGDPLRNRPSEAGRHPEP